LSDKGRREEGKSKARDWFSEEEICQNWGKKLSKGDSALEAKTRHKELKFQENPGWFLK
jgi:hypothetical protein